MSTRTWRSAALALLVALAAALAASASAPPAAWAGPAQEEYTLQIPDPRGGGGSLSPAQMRTRLSGGDPGGGAPAGSIGPVGDPSPAPGAGGRDRPGARGPTEARGGGTAGTGAEAEGDEALLAKARQDDLGSGPLTASLSALTKTPAGLGVLAALLLVAAAGALAVRRRNRARALEVE